MSLHILTTSSFSMQLIRDVELEEFSKELLLPLTKTSNLEKDRVDLYFINSNDVNAFVTSGQHIFTNTELIIQSSTYDEYLGVLAHELSHINGGHVSRTKEKISKLGDKSLPIYLLGILGTLTGQVDVGLAAIMVGSASVQDGYLYYSRTQEAAADQAAVALLCKSAQPVQGLESFLKKLDRSSLENAEDYKYKTTHPQTSDRYNWIISSYKKYPNCKYKLNDDLQRRFELIKGKLFAYTHSEKETLAIYSGKNTAEAQYAMATIYLLNGNYNKAIKSIKSLISSEENNPYFHEMLAEIYFSIGKHNLAILEQRKVIRLMSVENDLQLMILANYLLAEASKESLIAAIKALNKSLFLNPNNSYAWFLLAKGYALTGDLALAQYASSERYYLRGDKALALSMLKKAIKNIDNNSVEWYRANDLLYILTDKVENADDKKR